MRQAIGYALIASPFVALAVLCMRFMGVGATAFVFGISALVIAVISAGVFLVNQ